MKRSYSSPEFLYIICLIVILIVTCTCVLSLLPISILFMISPNNNKTDEALRYKNVINDWNSEYLIEFKNASPNLMYEINGGEKTTFIPKNEEYNFVNKDKNEFKFPSYEGLFYFVPNAILYENQMFYGNDSDLDASISLTIKNGDTTISIPKLSLVVKETRNVESEDDCTKNGFKLTDRNTCEGTWRLSGICLLLSNDAKELGRSPYAEAEASQSGCQIGYNFLWRMGTYDIPVKSGKPEIIDSQGGSFTVRSQYDPAVAAEFLTKGKKTFIETQPMKILIGILLLLGCLATVFISCFVACGSTICILHAKRMDHQYKYQEISQEASAVFAEDETLSSVSDEDNNANRRYRGDYDTI